MKNAIILHGMPDKESFYNGDNDSQIMRHWLPWLHQQLMIRDILTQIPTMPKPYAPVYKDWVETISQFKINKESILIGHSCGAGFWLRFLSENNIKINKLILVAPWLDPKKEIGDFFNFEFNLGGKVNEIIIFNSKDDFDEIQDSVNLISKKLPQAKVKLFDNMGHFTLRGMGRREFTELLTEVLK